jgi:hypothetical protein
MMQDKKNSIMEKVKKYNLKKHTLNKKNIAEIVFAFLILGILFFSVPVAAFAARELLSSAVSMDFTASETNLDLNITFNKTSNEVIHNVSVRLYYFDNWIALAAENDELYPETDDPAVYATRCYDSDGNIGLSGTGTAYQGYGYYGYGEYGTGYGYDTVGYGYGYGHTILGDFTCEFTVEGLPDGIYMSIYPYINDLDLGPDNALEFGDETALVLKSFNGTPDGTNNLILDEEFEFTDEIGGTGEVTLTLTIADGTDISHEDGVPFAVFEFASPPNATDILEGGDTEDFLSSIFTFEPSNIEFDPSAELCIQYNVSDSPLREIVGNDDDALDAYVRDKFNDDLLVLQYCDEDEGTCTYSDDEGDTIVLDTGANTICIDISHFTQISVVELEETTTGTGGRTSSGGATASASSADTTEEEETTEDETDEEDEVVEEEPYPYHLLTLDYSLDTVKVGDETTVTVYLTTDDGDVPASDISIEITTPMNRIITKQTDENGQIKFIPEYEGYYSLKVVGSENLKGTVHALTSIPEPPVQKPADETVTQQKPDYTWLILLIIVVVIIIGIIVLAGGVGGLAYFLKPGKRKR